MDTFSVKFKVGNLELDSIVTAFDHHQQFKVEMVTDEQGPILLSRSLAGIWTVLQRGDREISDQELKGLQTAIDQTLDQFYGASHMLVLTDFSESAANAARFAVALSQQLNTRDLLLYHSYESISILPSTLAPIAPGSVEYPEQIQKKIIALEQELIELAPSRLKITVHADERTLVTAVNTLVGQQHIGLVVIGVTGRSKLERALIGSNALDLAEGCLAPLLIIPPEAVFKGIKKVVFACDLKQVSQTSPVYAIKAFLNALNAVLLILNVDPSQASFDPDTMNEMTDLHKLWDDQHPEYHYINAPDIAKGIAEFAKKNGADMVITVPKVYGFFESLFHRSVTEQLTFYTHLPLLLFREES